MKEKILKGVTLILGSFLLVDLIVLNWLVFKNSLGSGQKITGLEVWLPSPTPTPSSPVSSQTCPASCLETISQATLSGGKPAPTATPRLSQTFAVKEFYVPLGTGSTTATVWTDIPAAEAYLNSANYGQIKSVTFEALLRVPGGNGRAYARLYNVNDKVGIFESEVSAEGAAGLRVESSKINLPAGNKLYRVQMKTSIGAESHLDLGRIKILVE